MGAKTGYIAYSMTEAEGGLAYLLPLCFLSSLEIAYALGFRITLANVQAGLVSSQNAKS